MRVMLKPFGLSSKVVFDDPAGLPCAPLQRFANPNPNPSQVVFDDPNGLPTAPLQRFGCCSPHGAFPSMAPEQTVSPHSVRRASPERALSARSPLQKPQSSPRPSPKGAKTAGPPSMISLSLDHSILNTLAAEEGRANVWADWSNPLTRQLVRIKWCMKRLWVFCPYSCTGRV